MSGPAFGQSNASSDTSDYNATDFIIKAAIAGMQTVSVVKVIAVHGGGVAPTGTVDVQVIINLMTGGGTAVPHGVIYGVPFNRTQGGNSAFICDPVVNDVGMAAFASRDITSVKNSRKVANPSSKRMFDWADAIYVSGMLNGTPTQYVQLASGGITVKSPTAINLQSPSNTITGPVTVTGTSDLKGAVTAESTIAATGAISSAVEVSAPEVATASLVVLSGGSVSVPAGSISDSALVPQAGVTPGTYGGITVNAQGIITAITGGGGGSVSVTDGTHTVSPASSIAFSGATVSGATPNATVTINQGGGGIGVPGTISNLCYWFQGDVLTAGGSFYPILLNETPGLANYSGGIISAAEITVSTTLNSKNVASFASSAEYILPGTGPTLAACTIFAVFNPATLSGNPSIFGGSSPGQLEMYITSGNQIGLVVQSVAIISNSTTTLAANTWVQANMTYSGTAWAFRIAQAAAGSGTGASRPASSGSGGIFCASNGSGGAGSPLTGQLAELCVYNRVLTGPEIASVEAYLHTKWNV